MNQIKKIFKVKKPIIGMLHLTYLERENFKGIDYVIQMALKDIEALQNRGIEGILIENWKEFSTGEFVSSETSKNFAQVVEQLVKHIKIPFGINVLNNDYKVMFSVAKLTGAAFTELDVFVDHVKSDFKYSAKGIENPFEIKGNPKEITDYAKSIGAQDIPLYVFIQPKHYIMLEKGKTIEESAKQAIEGGAAGLIVTKETGTAPVLDLVKRVKAVAGNTPVGIGSGFSAENAEEFLKVADFAIVGTSLKVGGITDNPVDPEKVKKLMSLVKKLRV